MAVRNQTYSNYKHHNTVKLLVAICPSGSITFVYEAWGRRLSDKQFALHSGPPELEGEVFSVDRQFRYE